jgi:hypothetical protein
LWPLTSGVPHHDRQGSGKTANDLDSLGIARSSPVGQKCTFGHCPSSSQEDVFGAGGPHCCRPFGLERNCLALLVRQKNGCYCEIALNLQAFKSVETLSI